jgi:DNA-binding protein H-NS
MARKPDLSKMKLDELMLLQKDVEVAIRNCRERNRKEARAAAEAAAAGMGFTLSDLMGIKLTGKSSRSPAPPKYRHPENPTLTWSGRGRKPAWFSDAFAAGVPEDEMLIGRQ